MSDASDAISSLSQSRAKSVRIFSNTQHQFKKGYPALHDDSLTIED